MTGTRATRTTATRITRTGTITRAGTVIGTTIAKIRTDTGSTRGFHDCVGAGNCLVGLLRRAGLQDRGSCTRGAAEEQIDDSSYVQS